MKFPLIMSDRTQFMETEYIDVCFWILILARRNRQLSECSGQSTGSTGEIAQKSLAQKFFETRQRVSTKFKSGHVNISYSSQFLINIDWHPWHQNKNVTENWKTNRLDFAEIIKKSIWSEMHTKSWCDEAGSYQNGNQTRQPLNLPEILGHSLLCYIIIIQL